MVIDNAATTDFPGASGYLNTASIGLPPSSAVAAMHDAISDWQAGRANAPDYDSIISEARGLFADLVAAPIERVAIGSQVSALVALVVTALEPGSRVLFPEGEFTSVIFPFLVRNDLDLEVQEVPLKELAAAIGPTTDMVAFSAVQSSSGEVADLDEVRAAAAACEALTVVDATQAAGWLPLRATDYDVVIAGAYKWLLSPRGTAFMALSDSVLERTRPIYAGWYGGESPWESIYGTPLRLASDARRLDLSPGWLAWVGTAPAIRHLKEVGVDTIHAHNVELANALLSKLQMPPTDSAIVSLPLAEGFDQNRLSGLSVAYRAGRLRVGFHLYNTLDDVAKVVAAVSGAVLHP